jgi:8-oxo-dGTP pyrophosphatase MutT (NUDIX family)
MTHAAGTMYMTPAKEALFLRRSHTGDHVGEWCFPGGGIDGDETAEQAAARESIEEIGRNPEGIKVPLLRHVSDGVDYTTFTHRVKGSFHPKLNDEHTGFAWAPTDDPPEPLHPGARLALKRLGMHELDIARSISTGEMSSPQKYSNVWLFAIRITGTGMAYRRGLNEYCWRDPDVYLNDDFLARCNGLPVIWEHPDKAVLNSEEYSQRVIGSIMLPYMKGDEVWGIAKIMDSTAAEEMSKSQLSTSPSVVFSDPSVNSKRTLEDGATLLIEGEPSLLDHIAICDLGVWDKAGPATGVLNEHLAIERADSMPTEEERMKADADAGEKLDKLLVHLDSMSQRMDAMEMADKARKDADEKEKMERDDRSRKDRARIDAEEHDKWAKDDAAMCAKDDAEEAEESKKFEGEGEPKEVAADKARKSRKDRMEARRKDAEAEKSSEEEKKVKEEEEKKADAAKRADASELETLRKRLAALENITKPVPEEDRAAFADIQARADTTYMSLGTRAPSPMQGETTLAYRTRLMRGVQKHSNDWSKIELHRLSPEVLSVAETKIYADADIAARNPDDVAAGTLREIVRVDPSTGQRMTTFVGNGTFIAGLKRPSRRVTNINTKAGS